MALEVCINSLYLIFLFMMMIKDTLMFYAIKKSQNNYEFLLLLMVIFDVIVLFTLPLMIAGTSSLCGVN